MVYKNPAIQRAGHGRTGISVAARYRCVLFRLSPSAVSPGCLGRIGGYHKQGNGEMRKTLRDKPFFIVENQFIVICKNHIILRTKMNPLHHEKDSFLFPF